MEFLLLLSTVWEPDLSSKDELCLLALAAGRPDYPPRCPPHPHQQRCELSRRRLGVKLSRPVGGCHPDGAAAHNHSLAPGPSGSTDERNRTADQWIDWHENGAAAEMNDGCADSFPSLSWAVIGGNRSGRLRRTRHGCLIDG